MSFNFCDENYVSCHGLFVCQHCLVLPTIFTTNTKTKQESSDGFVQTKIYDKRDDFDFDIVNFPFLDGDVPRSTSYGVYISQLIRFARVSSHVDEFNTRNKVLTAKLLRQGYRYHKIRIVSKYNVGLQTLLLEGLSEPEFYGDLVYKFR